MRTRNSLSFKALPLARNSREFDAGFGFALNVADVRPQKPTRRSKLDKNPDSATARSLVRRNGFFALTPNIRRGHPLSNACANAPVRRGDTINWVGGNLFSSSYATPSGRCGDKETAFAGVSFGRFRGVFRFRDNNSIVVAAAFRFHVDAGGRRLFRSEIAVFSTLATRAANGRTDGNETLGLPKLGLSARSAVAAP